MTTFFTLVIIAGIFTFVAARSSYPLIKFLAGVSWWLLGTWLVYNPLMAGANPVNDIALTLCFLGGFGIMIWLNWNTKTVNGREEGGFNFRMPKALGGRSEQEEAESNHRNARTSADRRNDYRERLENATRGRRE